MVDFREFLEKNTIFNEHPVGYGQGREGGNEGIKEIVHLKLGEMDGVT